MPSPPNSATRNGFDKLTAPYRWMEYLSFGPFLWRARCAFLPEMQHAQRALLLGDGDGRFTSALLRRNKQVRAHAVDASANMLRHLHSRVARQGNAARLCTLHADALTELPAGPFDLVCTHFFLDCLTDTRCHELVKNVTRRLQPDAFWVVSEFAVPAGSLNALAHILVRALYFSFGLLTGLRVRTLPDYAAAFRSAGLQPVAIRSHLCGILRSELWTLPQGRGPETQSAHPITHE